MSVPSTSGSAANKQKKIPHTQPSRSYDVDIRNTRTVLVHPAQSKNPVLKHIKKVDLKISSNIKADFVMGTTCALFLSLKFHMLKPDYIAGRLAPLKLQYRTRVLLILMDIEDPSQPLFEATKLASTNNFTVILSWSEEEAGRYVETLKLFEGKPATSIKHKTEQDNFSVLHDALTTVRGVNKRDVKTLSREFASFAEIVQGSNEEFSLGVGIGDTKAQNLFDAFNVDF